MYKKMEGKFTSFSWDCLKYQGLKVMGRYYLAGTTSWKSSDYRSWKKIYFRVVFLEMSWRITFERNSFFVLSKQFIIEKKITFICQIDNTNRDKPNKRSSLEGGWLFMLQNWKYDDYSLLSWLCIKTWNAEYIKLVQNREIIMIMIIGTMNNPQGPRKKNRRTENQRKNQNWSNHCWDRQRKHKQILGSCQRTKKKKIINKKPKNKKKKKKKKKKNDVTSGWQ